MDNNLAALLFVILPVSVYGAGWLLTLLYVTYKIYVDPELKEMKVWRLTWRNPTKYSEHYYVSNDNFWFGLTLGGIATGLVVFITGGILTAVAIHAPVVGSTLALGAFTITAVAKIHRKINQFKYKLRDHVADKNAHQ